MLEETDSLLLDQLGDHIAENGADGIEALVRRADIAQTDVVKEYLLDDENRDRLAQLGAGLHDAEAKRDDLSGEKEIDYVRGVVLHQGPDDTQRSETEVFERARLRGRVEKRVQKQGGMS